MLKRFAIVSAIIGTLCIALSAGAKMMMCTDEEMKAWGKLYSHGYQAACALDGSGDWSINVDLDNPSPYDDAAEAKADACAKAINQCNITHGVDVVSCLIARDNGCNYNPCTRAWQPYCISTNQCANAIDYCNGYISNFCVNKINICKMGDWAACSFVYDICGVTNCSGLWKPLCNETDNCLMSYAHCKKYLSSNCARAAYFCAYSTDPAYKNAACDYLYNTCGVPVPR